MRVGRSLGDAIADAIQSLPDSKTRRLRSWVEEVSNTRIYAYVNFRGSFGFVYGLMLTAGGPTDKIIAAEEVGGDEEKYAPYESFSNAMNWLGHSFISSRYFRENPFVEVRSPGEYNKALQRLEIREEDGSWELPGLYDFRKSPPVYAGTIEAYQRKSMREHAKFVIESMLEREDWIGVCEALLRQ